MAEQPKARRRNTKEELIKAGVEEINRYGVAGFSMRRIAQLCGVSCGAPYKHFGDRKEFIAAIIDDVNAQWHARQAELLAAYEGDTRKQIVEMSTGYVQFLAENPHLRAILTLKDRDFDNVYHRVRGELSSPTQRLIQRYCQEKQLDEETRQRKVYVVRSLIFGAAIQFDNGELPYSEHTLKMVHESFVLMSFHVWGLKSLRICCSISLTGIPAAGRFSSFSMTYVYGLSFSDAVLSS